MKHNLLLRLTALLMCLCLLPASALAYGDIPIYKVPVTHADMTVTFDLYADAFPDDGAADYQGWQTFLDKLSFKGALDVQNILTRDVRGWFDGGLYVNDRMTIPFQVDVYSTYRYLVSRALRGESLYFQMDNFLEFMMKPCYYMDLPSETIALFMYPEATLDIWDKFYTPLAKLCQGTGDRTVSYDDLYDLCLSWEEMYMADPDEGYKLYYFLTCLLYDLEINYDVYDQIGMLTSWLDVLDPESAGMTIAVEGDTETYTIGETVVFTRQLGEARNFTLALPDENGNLLTLESQEELGESKVGDDWQLTLAITLAPEEAGGEGENYLTLCLDMDNMPLRNHYKTLGTIVYTAEGSALEEPVSAAFELFFDRSDYKMPNVTWCNLSYIHPVTQQKCFSINTELWLQELPFTVMQEHEYPQEDLFHLNDEYLPRLKERYLPSLGLSFLPVIAEMPAGVLNDILRFTEETGILVSMGVE